MSLIMFCGTGAIMHRHWFYAGRRQSIRPLRIRSDPAAAVAAFVAIAIAIATAAHMQPRTVEMPDDGAVLIWRDSRAMSEGSSLIRAGIRNINPGPVVRILACIVLSATKVIITDHGFATCTNLVTDSCSSGCRGDVETEFAR